MIIDTTIGPIKKVSEKVLEILEDEILSGERRPGERLVEREIAARLGVSRVPIREALITLERWGFVKGANNKWREIVALTKEDISECYHVRSFLECQAFSEKSLENDRVLFDSLAEMVDKMDQYSGKNDVENYRKINARFHDEFILSLNNKRLFNIYSDISRMLKWFQNITLYVPRMKKSNEEHRLLLEAYNKQDLYEIRRLFQVHYKHAVELLAKRITAA